MKDCYPGIRLVRISRLLGIARQAYYQHFWQQEAIGIEESPVLAEVLAIRENHRAMGGRKICEKLQTFFLNHQIKMGGDALFNLLSVNGLLVKKRRRRFVTTHSKHWLKKWPNLIRGFKPTAINGLWVSDITYFKIAGKYTYISLMTDANEQIKKLKEDSVSDDDIKVREAEGQKLTDAYILKVDKHTEVKEKEVMTV